MNANLAALLYLVAGILFILALRGLSSPASSRQGNRFGMIGMAIAILTTLALKPPSSGVAWLLVILGFAIGGSVGVWRARTIQMTAMPQLVAMFHSLVGLAAVLVAAGALYAPHAFGIDEGLGIHPASIIEMSLGQAIGAITFTGSVIAFLKLDGRMSGAPILLPQRHVLNGGLGVALIVLIAVFYATQAPAFFWLIALVSLTLGVTLIIPIGGADMPVVISMLNSYSGWAAAGIGFTLGNLALIITGALVGSSGAILSYIMCKGMNRSFISVILGGWGGEVAGPCGREGDPPGQAGFCGRRGLHDEERLEGDHRAGLRHGGRARAALLARDGRPSEKGRRRGQIRDPSGRGPHAGPHERAARRGQRALRRGVRARGHQQRVRPGRRRLCHRGQRRHQPGRQDDPKSPIYGMPVLDVDKAKTVLFVKRGMGSGYAGVENELFFRDNTMMLFGDAKKMTDAIVKALGH